MILSNSHITSVIDHLKDDLGKQLYCQVYHQSYYHIYYKSCRLWFYFEDQLYDRMWRDCFTNLIEI